MALSAECGHCFRLYKNLPDSALGKAFKCKSCGEPVRVDAPNTTDDSYADLAPAPTVGSRPTSATPKAASADTTALKKIGSVLVTIICVALVGLKIYGRATRHQRRANNEAVAATPVQQSALSPTVTPQPVTNPVDVADFDPTVSRIDETEDTSPVTLAGLKNFSPPTPEEFANSERAVRKPAYVEALESSPKTAFLVPVVAGMTDEEFVAFEKQHRIPGLLPLMFNTSLMQVPHGFELNDDELLRKRKELTVKTLQKREKVSAMAGAIERFTLEEYRAFEKTLALVYLEAMRRSMTNGPLRIRDLKPEEITVGENGYQFPARIQDRIFLSARKQVETGLERVTNELARIASGDTPFKESDELPFWAPLEIRVAAERDWTFSPGRNSNLPGTADSYAFPCVPSPFICGGLTGFNKGQLVAFDIRTGDEIGKLAVPIENGDLHLSPDGKRVILEKTMPGVGKDYFVYSLETGQQERVIHSPKAHVVSWAAYITPDRFATFEAPERASGEDRLTVVYDVKTGDRVVEFPHSGSTFDDFMAVSPDGHYLARLSHGNEIDLFDLQEGRQIAKQKFPSETGRTLETLAFSNDGKHLAILSREIYTATNVRVVDCQSGRETQDFWLPGDFSNYLANHASYEGPDLAWFPDDTALWIAGASVVDLERERELVRYTPEEQGFSISKGVRVPLQDGVAVLNEQQRSTVLEFMPIDFETLRSLADKPAEELALVADSDVALDLDLDKIPLPDGGVDIIQEAISEALDGSLFTVVDEAPIAFRITPYGRAKTSTSATGKGQTLTAEFDLEWVQSAEKKSLWKHRIKVYATDTGASAGSADDPLRTTRNFANSLKKAIQEAPIPETIGTGKDEFLPAIGRTGSTKRSSRRRRS